MNRIGTMAFLSVYISIVYFFFFLSSGGTGITPHLQVIDQVLSDSADKTNITLLTFNTTPSDVLLKEKLDGYVSKHPNQVKVIYVVDKDVSNADWVNETGHVNRAMLDKYLPKPSNEIMIYTCGPPR